MTIRSTGPSAGFGWLKHAIGIIYRHPKPLLGGAAFLLLVCMLPTLVTLPMQLYWTHRGSPPNLQATLFSMAGSMTFGLLLVPLYAGYLQVIDAAERGLPARARDIFKPYRQGEALPVIGYALALAAISTVLLGVIVLATGGGLVGWYVQLLAAQAGHLPPPALPHGFGIAMALCLVLWLFMMAFYAVSLGQIALRRRSVFGALGDGFVGALKNLLPMLMLAVGSILAWIVVAIALVLVFIVVGLLGLLVGKWLMLVLMVPVEIALVLAGFAVMFGVMYHLWRDVCGDAAVISGPPPIAH